jgi:hypothetical protein
MCSVHEREHLPDVHGRDPARLSVHQPNCSIPSLDAPGVQFRSFVEASRSSAASSVPAVYLLPRSSTRLQHGITKPKIYTDDTVRYNMLATSDGPHDLHDALSSTTWKQAMDMEFDALQKNRTWYLVPPGIQCHRL